MFEKIFGRKDDILAISDYPSLWPRLNLEKVVKVWKRLGGESEVDRFLKGKLAIVSKWYEKDNIIYLSVPLVNDGKTFEQWNAYLRERKGEINYHGLDVSWREKGDDHEKFIEGLEPQIAIAKIAIMRNDIINDKEQKTLNNFRKEGEKHGLIDINPWFMYCLMEVLDRDDFKTWGFDYIQGAHQPLKGVDKPQRLYIGAYNSIKPYLACSNDCPDTPITFCAFAFAVKDRDWYSAYSEEE